MASAMASLPPPAPPYAGDPLAVTVPPPLPSPTPPSPSLNLSPSLLIIGALLAFVLCASVSIHFLLRCISRHPSPTPSLLPTAHRARASSSPSAAPSPTPAEQEVVVVDDEKERLIASLPLFTMASALAALPKSSPDCAVCLSAFQPDAELRLLPACRHAFHKRCVDPWLRANPSCPLCRASIALPYPPLPELLRIELGSVSSRRSTSSSSAAVSAAPPEGAAAAVRAYPLPSLPNSTTEYLVEEDLQVVLKPPPPLATTARITGEPSQQLVTTAERALQPQPSLSVTPTASFRSVGRSSSRWSNRWSSRWSSGRWSSRYDAGSVTAAATAEWWWDMDGGVAPAVARRGEAEDGSAFYGFVRWLTGAY